MDENTQRKWFDGFQKKLTQCFNKFMIKNEKIRENENQTEQTGA